MAAAVEEVLREGGILMVEAATGTGKTLAYLVPALASGQRVVVSTGTRNLQDQIVLKDLPLLREQAGLQVSACLLKGRDNYLCRYRFARFESNPLVEVPGEDRYLPLLRAWARTTRTGDRAEVAELPDNFRLWRDINARAETCTGTRCPEVEFCWLTQARRSAQESKLVIVNHHLFFADLAVRTSFGPILADYDAVIFDEAHRLEEVASQFFGIHLSTADLEDLARDLERLDPPRGGAAFLVREASKGLLEALRRAYGEEPGRFPFRRPEEEGPRLDPEARALAESLEEAAREAGRGSRGDTAEALAERARQLSMALDFLLARESEEFVYQVDIRSRRHAAIQAVPVDVSELLSEALFSRVRAAVLTSATLAVDGSFDFFRKRLGIRAARTLVVSSPFELERQAVLYIPRSVPEPRDPGYLPRALDEIRELLDITGGRAFLLFTSYAVLEKVRQALARDGRWSLLVQGEGSRTGLLERFREGGGEGAVLLGTSSFWQGVDVPGEALSLVVIDKLPFDVPTDPVVRARVERIRRQGGNPFVEYQTPLAILELKQGLGRLIRSRTDRGILAVLDSRLWSRPYGAAFLRSLPPYRIVEDLGSCRAFFRSA
jgi:ATP-dependent DNA helicase DinG